jgi:hypothetical protein
LVFAVRKKGGAGDGVVVVVVLTPNFYVFDFYVDDIIV